MSGIRAIGLLSGGLDSALAARLMLDQGIEVVGLHLESPTTCRSDVHDVARDLGIRLEVREKGQAFVELLRHPKYGYGKNMNPCIDCRSFMFRLAQPLMEQFGARFVFTGEVLGQRPMSQMRNSIRIIDRESEIEGYILRPLSARLLPESVPEQEGWVDRSKLLGISGRSREAQLRLAREYGLKYYASPGGGCLLTDPIYSEKLRDLFDHADEGAATMTDLALLRLGRHFRVRPDLKVVLGRNEQENDRLRDFAGSRRWLVVPDGFPGPVALVEGPQGEASFQHALRLIARYTRTPHDGYRVRWMHDGREVYRPLDQAHDLVQIRPA